MINRCQARPIRNFAIEKGSSLHSLTLTVYALPLLASLEQAQGFVLARRGWSSRSQQGKYPPGVNIKDTSSTKERHSRSHAAPARGLGLCGRLHAGMSMPFLACGGGCKCVDDAIVDRGRGGVELGLGLVVFIKMVLSQVAEKISRGTDEEDIVVYPC